MKIAVVTGASSGMGKEFVKQLQAWCKNLDEIWVIARRKEQLEALKQQGRCKIRVVDGDLLDETFMTRFQGLLLQEHPSVKILVNSAGMGRNGSVTEISRENPSIQKKMTELNTAALVEMTEAVLPYMGAGSRILNLASDSAFFPQPGFAVYAATKAFVLSFSRSLGRELADRKIFVTAVCPGPVDTAFFEQEGMKVSDWKKPFLAKADRVVALALKDSARRKPVSVYGISMKCMRILSKIVPNSWILAVTDRIMNSNKKSRNAKEH